MLQFVYECISEYIIENSFELTETDTDSIYMAINKPYRSIDQCIKPTHQSRYQKEIFNSCSDNENPIWFPRRCCRRHLALDGRYLGTYKCEWEGIKMVSLCSKSYIIQDSKGNHKISCKGISKKNLEDPMKKFEDALYNKTTIQFNNVGFRVGKSDIYTYFQEKIGFNYFYCKREVLADGISTVPLNITLSPWETSNLVVDNTYFCEINLEGTKYHSSEQYFYHIFANFTINQI